MNEISKLTSDLESKKEEIKKEVNKRQELLNEIIK
jgi:hypothetical protein